MYTTKPLKKNGFVRPFHFYQVLSWFISIFTAVCTLTLAIPLFPRPTREIHLSVFLCSLVSYLVLGFIVTHSDPTDPSIFLYHSNSDRNVIQRLEEINERYCSICISPVDYSSKHCMRCGRCSIGFDHHCKWVNNCIGKSNYKAFICLIVNVSVYHSFLLYLHCKAGQIVSEMGKDEESSFRDYGKELFYTTCVGLAIDGAVVFVVLALDLYLVLYHAYIAYRGITTYEHITLRTKKTFPISGPSEKSCMSFERHEDSKNLAPCNIEAESKLDATVLLKV